jgi:hypothetical protein
MMNLYYKVHAWYSYTCSFLDGIYFIPAMTVFSYVCQACFDDLFKCYMIIVFLEWFYFGLTLRRTRRRSSNKRQ